MNYPSSIHINDDIMSTIAAMLRQEETSYQKSDYLYQQYEPEHHHHSNLPLSINANCRHQMATWCYQVIDFCKFDREIVEIAMSCLDRFMTTPAAATAKADPKEFQLTTMTCLYTAIKVHAPASLSLKLVSDLSRGVYSESQIQAKEAEILTALRWRVNPPTALAFVRKLLRLIPKDILDQDTATSVYEVAKFQIELSIGDYSLITVKPSAIAYSSLMNALQSFCQDAKAFQQIALTASQIYNIDSSDSFVIQLQNSLLHAAAKEDPSARVAIIRNTTSNPLQTAGVSRKRSFAASPRSARVTP